MSNVFGTIGKDIKTGAKDTGKALETAAEYAIVHPVEFIAKAETVVATAIKDQPAIKAAVLGLVKQATVVIGDAGTAAGAKGINLADDAKALADAEAFFDYFKTAFMPAVEAVYKEVEADVK